MVLSVFLWIVLVNTAGVGRWTQGAFCLFSKLEPHFQRSFTVRISGSDLGFSNQMHTGKFGFGTGSPGETGWGRQGIFCCWCRLQPAAQINMLTALCLGQEWAALGSSGLPHAGNLARVKTGTSVLAHTYLTLRSTDWALSPFSSQYSFWTFPQNYLFMKRGQFAKFHAWLTNLGHHGVKMDLA